MVKSQRNEAERLAYIKEKEEMEKQEKEKQAQDIICQMSRDDRDRYFKNRRKWHEALTEMGYEEEVIDEVERLVITVRPHRQLDVGSEQVNNIHISHVRKAQPSDSRGVRYIDVTARYNYTAVSTKTVLINPLDQTHDLIRAMVSTAVSALRHKYDERLPINYAWKWPFGPLNEEYT